MRGDEKYKYLYMSQIMREVNQGAHLDILLLVFDTLVDEMESGWVGFKCFHFLESKFKLWPTVSVSY